MKILEIEKLNKSYEKFSLKDVSFSLEKGFIMGFIGANGAGKTTTLKSILNMVNYESGKITIFGKDFYGNSKEIKQKIGYMLGDANFYTRRKLKTITGVVKRFYDNWSDETYERLIKKFGLDEDKKVYELSEGMKIKYSLVLALSHDASLLLLDEPTSGLDPVARDELLELFQELVEDGEKSILFSTHITSDLDKCADFITYINDGIIIDSMQLDDFKNSYRVISGSTESLEIFKDRLISYKSHSLGFIGLIRTRDLTEENINAQAPELDDIMIYYARRDRNND